MKFTASGREAPQAAQFRVAVDENGAVRYCFLERSSGDAALDEQARKYLTLSRFTPIENRQSEIENGFVWGTATIEWGNDLVRAAPTRLKVWRRDSGQSFRAGHDLFAGFSCGGFPPLDSWRVESSPTRTTRFALSVALRDLRV